MRKAGSRARSGTWLNAVRDTKAASAVEFGLLAPILLIMLFGVLQVGVYLQNYNAVQSLASDGARYAMVEYQKDNQLTDAQLRSVLLGMATNSPYLLDTNRVEIDVDRTGTSRVDGAVEIDLNISYTLWDFIPGLELPLTVVRYSRSVWVVP